MCSANGMPGPTPVWVCACRVAEHMNKTFPEPENAQISLSNLSSIKIIYINFINGKCNTNKSRNQMVYPFFGSQCSMK